VEAQKGKELQTVPLVWVSLHVHLNHTGGMFPGIHCVHFTMHSGCLLLADGCIHSIPIPSILPPCAALCCFCLDGQCACCRQVRHLLPHHLLKNLPAHVPQLAPGINIISPAGVVAAAGPQCKAARGGPHTLSIALRP